MNAHDQFSVLATEAGFTVVAANTRSLLLYHPDAFQHRKLSTILNAGAILNQLDYVKEYNVLSDATYEVFVRLW